MERRRRRGRRRRGGAAKAPAGALLVVLVALVALVRAAVARDGSAAAGDAQEAATTATTKTSECAADGGDTGEGGRWRSRNLWKERFDEELVARRVPEVVRGVEGMTTLATHLRFTTRWQQEIDLDDAGNRHGDAEFEWDHFDLFPKQLGQMLDAFEVEEMRLSFSKGTWDHQHWGVPFEPVPSGVELWAVLPNQTVYSPYGMESMWTRMTRGLAGTTCASLEALDARVTSNPLHSFGIAEGSPHTVYYGQLNSEASCTENLTPWIKLLPCRAAAGLAKLIVPTVVFRAEHHSFSIHFRRVCYDSERSKEAQARAPWFACRRPTAELTLSLTTVNRSLPSERGLLASLLGMDDTDASSGPKISAGSGSRGKVPEASACSVATTSKILVEDSAPLADGKGWAPGPCMVGPQGSAPKALRVVDLIDADGESGGPWRTITDADLHVPSLPAAEPLVTVERFMSGFGRVHGGVVAQIKVAAREGRRDTLLVRFFETVPAYLRFKPSSLEVTVNGKRLGVREVWDHARIALGHLNKDPTVMELDLQLPYGAEATVSYGFRQAFLPLQDFPPDPNRGFDVPAVVVSYTVPQVEGCDMGSLRHSSPSIARKVVGMIPGRRMRVYSQPLMVSMPLPDFSMPYNVITLSSTVMAFFFASLIHALKRDPDNASRARADEASRKRQRRQAMAKNLFFAAILVLAWLFENDRDSFDALVQQWSELEAAVTSALS